MESTGLEYSIKPRHMKEWHFRDKHGYSRSLETRTWTEVALDQPSDCRKLSRDFLRNASLSINYNVTYPSKTARLQKTA
ncbi:hypothetical protein J6590_049708 [Homalodisca vitripennis]|nr:hypothetical protein J6590_049708 [Homalodisca vitripennis]